MALHLVTGGSGFVGSNIARLLANRGEEVRVLDLWYEEKLSDNIEFIQGDITNRDLVERAMRGVDYVHHNVALVPLTKAGARFDEVNVGGTRIALEAARKEGVKLFSHMSSSAIFGSPDLMPITNDTPMIPIEIYGKAKYDADILVQKAGKEGMPVSVVRPRTIVGNGRLGIFEILFDWIRDNANIFIIGSGEHLFQFVHNDDLCEVSIQTCLQEKPGIYNVGTSEFGSLRQDLGALITHAGSTSKIRGLPVRPTIATLSALDKMHLSPLGPWHYLTYHKPFYFDSSPVTEALGWKPQYTNQKILTNAYDWFIANFDAKKNENHTSMHKKPVKQGILRLMKTLSRFV